MIYTTFEQIEYGFVLLDINKKYLDINRFRKYKIERFGLNRPLQYTLKRKGKTSKFERNCNEEEI